jgi:hypothetical protein
MFLLAGGETDICYDFILYTGKGEKLVHGFCTKVVIDLYETVPRGMNHILFSDNFYTTIRLQVELKKLGMYCIGTVRLNRLPDLSMKNLDDLSREGRGAMDHRVAEVDGVCLCTTRWLDNNVVHCFSTLYGCESTDFVRRWCVKQKQYIEIQRPHVIKLYNQGMGVADLVNMLIALYRITIRSKNTNRRLFFT